MSAYSSDASKQEVVKKINEKLNEAEKALEEATQLAREAKVHFSWSGPAYGMGGDFDWESSTDQYGQETDGWLASSNSC